MLITKHDWDHLQIEIQIFKRVTDTEIIVLLKLSLWPNLCSRHGWGSCGAVPGLGHPLHLHRHGLLLHPGRKVAQGRKTQIGREKITALYL